MPVNYSIPSWLEQTPDVAGKFLSGVQVGAAIGEARNKLAAQQQQFAVEAQQKQDQITASALKEAQELNVQKAYNDQQISLKQQALQIADQKVGQETLKAAHQYQAQQQYKTDFADYKASNPDATDEEAARASMFKNIGMFGSGGGSVATALHSANRGGAPTTSVVTDSAGRSHTLARIPGSLAFTDLDRGGATGGDWQDRHDLTRKEKLQDRQFSSIDRKLTAAQKALDETPEPDPKSLILTKEYQQKKQRVADLSAQMDKLSGGTQSNQTPPTDEEAPPEATTTQQPLKVTGVRLKASEPAQAPTQAAPVEAPAQTVTPAARQVIRPQAQATTPAELPTSMVQETPLKVGKQPALGTDNSAAQMTQMAQEGTKRNISNMSAAKLRNAAEALGITVYDDPDGTFRVKTGGYDLGKKMSRKKVEQMIYDAANEQQVTLQ